MSNLCAKCYLSSRSVDRVAARIVTVMVSNLVAQLVLPFAGVGLTHGILATRPATSECVDAVGIRSFALRVQAAGLGCTHNVQRL